MAANKAAPSTMGTLLATALMRAGKEVMGKSEISGQDLVAMFKAADLGMQERGKAKPGDKTIIDALHPAYEAFAAAIEQGASLSEAGAKALAAAESGRDSVTPLRSKVGRASWVGERTEGQVDPGCEALVVMLKTVIS
jgi:dihydroxyacetone kinase